jgi:hypothetical protein
MQRYGTPAKLQLFVAQMPVADEKRQVSGALSSPVKKAGRCLPGVETATPGRAQLDTRGKNGKNIKSPAGQTDAAKSCRIKGLHQSVLLVSLPLRHPFLGSTPNPGAGPESLLS